MEDCLPDQVRVDHGREFYLTLFVQESLVPLRTNTQRDPHWQTESKKVTICLYKRIFALHLQNTRFKNVKKMSISWRL